MLIEVRHERAGDPASRALFAAYLDLVCARVGPAFMPTEDIFATEDAFAAPGAAWLVVYEDGRPVACGGMRQLELGVGEVKRMYVADGARRRGHGRRLLAELERLALAAGHTRMRLLTTEVLVEARALYRAAGYREIRADRQCGRRDVWLEKLLDPPG